MSRKKQQYYYDTENITNFANDITIFANVILSLQITFANKILHFRK